MTDPPSQLWFVFNELSVGLRADSHHEGHSCFDGIVIAVAKVMGGRPAQLVSIGRPVLWEAELAAGYTVAHWCASAEPDLRQLLLGIATKTEFPDEVGSILSDRFRLSEFYLTEGAESEVPAEARGLGAAYLLDGIGVSLPSDRRWAQTRIALQHLWLDRDCHAREDTVEVLNLSEPTHAEQVSDSIVRRFQLALAEDPLRFSARKNECFPHLSFGRAVDRYVSNLPSAILSRVVQKLMILDDACRKWRQDETMTFPGLSDCRAESGPTMQQYGDRRIFSDPEGRDQTYERHVPVGTYRIHLRLVHQPRGIEIGYVGRHLPTARYH